MNKDVTSALFDPNGNQIAGSNPVFVRDPNATSLFPSPSACDNSATNPFLIAYLTGAAGRAYVWFNTLDANGINSVGPVEITSPPGGWANSYPFCCYNTANNQ
jgi:hypothetical protein